MSTRPALTTVPYESAIGVKPMLVGWCDYCECVDAPYPGKGSTCPGDHEWERWAYYKHGTGTSRGLRKRLAWPCPICDFYFKSRTGLLEHEHAWL